MQFSSIRKPKVKLEERISVECVANQIQTRVFRNFPKCRRTSALTEAYLRGAKEYLSYPMEILAVTQRISNDTPNRMERSRLHSIKRDVRSVGSETRVTSGAILNIHISR